jgi:hypothetical protein
MTERHRFYILLSALLGLLIGALSGALIAVGIGVVLTGFGGSILFVLEKAYGKNKNYVFWMSVAIGAIAVGSCFLIGAIIFLTLHEAGQM